MKVRKEWISSKKPATKGDLADLQEDIHADLSELTERTGRIEQNMATKGAVKGVMSQETGEAVLDYMKSIDKSLKPLRGIPEEVTKLRNRVFKLELRR